MPRLAIIVSIPDRITKNEQQHRIYPESIIHVDRKETAELRNTVTALVQIVEVHQANHEASQRNFEASQRNFDRIFQRLEILEAEIKGLRTESLRILEHLFGQQPD
jgi:hypothetical protein